MKYLAKSSSSAYRILLIDDDDLTARAVARLLSSSCLVQIASSAETAIALLAGEDWFDAILCDVRLPGLSGPDLVTDIRFMSFAQSRRVIYLTGNPELVDHDRPVVEKPFAAAALREIVFDVAGRNRPGTTQPPCNSMVVPRVVHGRRG